LGGGVLDLGRGLVGLFHGGEVPASSVFLAYGLVFMVQAVGMVLAVVLLRRGKIQEFQANARAAITAALESDMD
ncbi:MAG: MFS transporter, partial [Leptolyngbya sp.]